MFANQSEYKLKIMTNVDDFEIMHVVESGKLKTESCISVYFSSDFNRKSIQINDENCHKNVGQSQSNHDFEHLINVIWVERVSLNPRLFNGTKFRIHNINEIDSMSNKGNGQVALYLGITDYKEFIGTNWSPHAKFLQQQGLANCGNSQAFLSDALGVGASVLTMDGKLILLKRSNHCAEAPSMWDVPGGHAEPSNVVGEKSLAEIDVAAMCSASVCHEIFDSITREVVDEVNIPASKLTQPLYMGTHRNLLSAGRPSMAFVINCELTSEEVQALYNQGNQIEADETTNIMFLPLDSVSALTAERNGVWETLAPSARGNLTIFCLVHGMRREDFNPACAN